MGRRPRCCGISGNYRRGGQGPEESWPLSGWDEPPVRDQDKLYDIAEVLVEVAKDRGSSPAQVVLAWLLERLGVTSVIIGTRISKQLAHSLGPADLTAPPRSWPGWKRSAGHRCCNPPGTRP